MGFSLAVTCFGMADLYERENLQASGQYRKNYI